MAVNVEFQTTTVDIKNLNKETFISLTKEAWQTLIAYKKELDDCLKEKTELEPKVIDESKKINVHISEFKENLYLHIRYWWKEKPTKNGVTFNISEWEELKTYMNQDEETALGIAVWSNMLRTRMNKIKKEECYGCRNSWPSQRDHLCLMPTEDDVGLMFDKALLELKDEPINFISALAQEAQKELVILERPYLTFKRVKDCLINDIREKLIMEFLC